MMISVNAGKSLDRMGHPFIIKTCSKVRVVGNFSVIEWIYEKCTANILNDKMLNVFTLRLIIKQECLPWWPLFIIVLGVLPSTRREEKEIKEIHSSKAVKQ